MAKGVIDVRSSEIEAINSQLRKSAAKMESAATNMKSDFSGIVSTGLLNTSTSLINKQMDTIRQNINRTDLSVSSSYDNLCSTETLLKNKAEEITVPLDFVKNDSSSSIGTKETSLDKKDGQEINSDNSTDEEELKFEKALDYNEKLKSIIKDYEDIHGEIEINGSLKGLGNIKKDSDTDEKTLGEIDGEKTSLDDMSGSEEKQIDDKVDYTIKHKDMLDNINKEINERHPEFNDSFDVEEVYVEDVKTDNVTEEDLTYEVFKESIAEKLNDGNYVLENYKK